MRLVTNVDLASGSSKLNRAGEVVRAPRNGVFEPLQKPPLRGPHVGTGSQNQYAGTQGATDNS